MKKLLCTLLCALLIISVMPAFARTTDVMTVANCNEYVSLRQTNSTSASVLRKVHLGEFVTNCIKHDDQFTYCEFDGACGVLLRNRIASELAAAIVENESVEAETAEFFSHVASFVAVADAGIAAAWNHENAWACFIAVMQERKQRCLADGGFSFGIVWPEWYFFHCVVG